MADAWDFSEAVRLNAIERTQIRYLFGFYGVGNFKVQRFSTNGIFEMSDVLTITDQFRCAIRCVFLGRHPQSSHHDQRVLRKWVTTCHDP